MNKQTPTDPYAQLRQAYREGKKIELSYGITGYLKWYRFAEEPLYMLPVERYRIAGE